MLCLTVFDSVPGKPGASRKESGAKCWKSQEPGDRGQETGAKCSKSQEPGELPVMRLPPGLLLLALPVLLALPGKVQEQEQEQEQERQEQEEGQEQEEQEEQGSARVFPLLPPYANVDFGANFNKLKSSGDAAYFVVRDSTVVSKKKSRPKVLTMT